MTIIFAGLIVTSILLLFFGVCGLLNTFIVDIEHCLSIQEENFKSSVKRDGKLSNQTRIELKENLSKIIRFYSDSLKLTYQCSEVFDAITSLLIMLFTFNICWNLFQVNIVSLFYYCCSVLRIIKTFNLLL